MSYLDKEIRRNIQDEIDSIVTDAVHTLKQRIESLKSEHAEKGCLRSSGTMQETKGIILKGNKDIYQSSVNYLTSIESLIPPSLKSEILSVVANSVDTYKAEQIEILKEIERLVGGFPLDKIILEIKNREKFNYSKFENQINSLILKSTIREKISTSLKVLLWIVALLLSSSFVISVMWFVDPEGNYEPSIVMLTTIAALFIFLKEIVFSKKT